MNRCPLVTTNGHHGAQVCSIVVRICEIVLLCGGGGVHGGVRRVKRYRLLTILAF